MDDRVQLLLELDSITKELQNKNLLSVVKFAEAALHTQKGKRQQRSTRFKKEVDDSWQVGN